MRPAPSLNQVAMAILTALIVTHSPALVLAVVPGVYTAPASAAAPGSGGGSDSSPRDVAPAGSLVLVATDRVTGEPVPWANLISLDGARGYLADEHGTFRLSLPAGPARFRVAHVSYDHSEMLSLEIPSGDTLRLAVQLSPRAHEAPTVKVHVDRHGPTPARIQGMRTVTMEETNALPNPTDDVFRMVRLLPGVSAGDVGSRFHLRGGGVDQMLVRLDGMELREFFHGRDFGGITSVVPAAAIQEMDVYAAGFPAEFGGRLSGAVKLDLKSRGEDGLHGRFSADATSARMLTEWHGESASMFVSGREGYLHRVLDALQDEATVQPAYRDLLVHAVHRPDATRSISFNYLRTEDHALYRDRVATHFVNADYEDDYLWTSFRLLASRRLAVSGTLHGARNVDSREFDVNGASHLRRQSTGARLQSDWSLPGSHVLGIGGQVEREWGEFGFRSPGSTTVIARGQVSELGDEGRSDEFDRVLGGAWIQDEWRATSRLTLHVGARYSWDNGTNESLWAPRGSAVYQIGGSTTVRGYWGAYDQAPKLVPQTEFDEQLFSDRIQKAEHRGLGVEQSVLGVRLGVDAYEKVFHRLDGIVSRFQDDVEERHVITHGLSRGVEVSAQRDGRWSNWWVAYSLGHSEWTGSQRTFTRDFDQLHTVTVSNTLNLTQGWDLGLSYAFHTGTPYTEQSWQREGVSDWTLTEGSPNGARLPAYHRMDVRLRRNFSWDSWRMSLYAEALNVTNHPNVLWYGWRIYDDNGPLSEAERVTRKGIPGVPSVGLEIRF